MLYGKWSSRVTLPVGPQWGDPDNGKGGVAACMNWTRSYKDYVSERPKTGGGQASSRGRPQSAAGRCEGGGLMVNGRASQLEVRGSNKENTRQSRPTTATGAYRREARPPTAPRPPTAGRPPGGREAWGDTQPWTEKKTHRSYRHHTPGPESPRHDDPYHNSRILRNNINALSQPGQQSWSHSRPSSSGRKPPLPPKSVMSTREMTMSKGDVTEEWKYTKYEEQNLYDLFDTDPYSPQGITGMTDSHGAGIKSYKANNIENRRSSRGEKPVAHHQPSTYQRLIAAEQGRGEHNGDIAKLEKHHVMNRHDARPSRDGPLNSRDRPVHETMGPPLPNKFMQPYRPKGLMPRPPKQKYGHSVDYDSLIKKAHAMAKQSRRDYSNNSNRYSKKGAYAAIQPTITTFRDSNGNKGEFTLRVDCKEQPVSSLTIRVTDANTGVSKPSFKVASYTPQTSH